MEEASLDDFFAKKDKSKKKSKSSKQTLSDNLANPDEPVKKDKKSKKDKDKSQASYSTKEENRIIGIKVKPEEEEEWNEQEEEKDPDYTGLRIANLQVSEETTGEEEEQTEENEGEEDENGEIKEKKDSGQQGPWKGGSAPVPAPKPKPVVEEVPVEEAASSEPSAPKAPAKYVPPSQRAGAAGSQASGPTLPGHLRKKKVAPNLRSEEDFPTLGGGPMPGDGSFERVNYGGKTSDDPTKSSQQLSLGNKFSALQD